MGKLQTLQAKAREHPEQYWGKIAEDIFWFKRWTTVLDSTNAPFYKWFSGGTTNACFNAVDRHVGSGRADQAALIYDSPVTNTTRTYTYRQLQSQVARVAGMLLRMGVHTGDRVIIYMPMIPETVFAMLACARIGAVHSVVFGGFAARELAVRIDDATPVVILTASCGIEPNNRIVEYKPLVDEAIRLSTHKPAAVVLLQRPECRAPMDQVVDHDWQSELSRATEVPCVPVDACAPAYVLYTSGTTGKPKGVVRSTADHIVALQWTMTNIYNTMPGQVFWAASDVGWVVGHSYIVYGPLVAGCTTILYEGKPVGTPDASAFWRVLSQHKVTTLFCAPTALRAIVREDPAGQLSRSFDLSSFRQLFLAGERCDPNTLDWAQRSLQRPVVDHWWQTETGWPVAAMCLGIEPRDVKPGSCSMAVPGWDVRVLKEDTLDEVPRGQIGSIVMKLPLPPGSLATLWQKDQHYKDSYLSAFPGFYATGDAGYIDEDGYIHIMARTDDIINVAGHRLSTGGMEEILMRHPDVAECAVFGVADELKGELPLGLLVLKNGTSKDHATVCKQAIELVRQDMGPVAAFKLVAVVARLPKTRSGKILRGTMKKIADRVSWAMPATVDDPTIFGEIEHALNGLGLAARPNSKL
jgi:propionyl-CoA synthetase